MKAIKEVERKVCEATGRLVIFMTVFLVISKAGMAYEPLWGAILGILLAVVVVNALWAPITLFKTVREWKARPPKASPPKLGGTP